jgi:hypothetical protein
MSPLPTTARRWSNEKLVRTRSTHCAAFLQLEGHPLIAIDFDPRLRRTVYVFEANVQADLERLIKASDTLHADAERVLGGRR